MVSVIEIVESKKIKVFSKYLINIGITIVIIGGALIVRSITYGNIIASVGGIMIGLFYFFKAFKPLQERLDWSLVHPQLNKRFMAHYSQTEADNIVKLSILSNRIKIAERKLEQIKRSL